MEGCVAAGGMRGGAMAGRGRGETHGWGCTCLGGSCMAGRTAGGDERWVCEDGRGWGCPWAMVQPWGVPVLDPPQPPDMCQPQSLEWVLGGTGLSPSGSWGSHWGSAPCWEGKGDTLLPAPPPQP